MITVAEAIVTHDGDSEGGPEEGRFRELDVQAQPAKGPLQENWRLIKKDVPEVFYSLLRGGSRSVWRTSTHSRATRVVLSKLVAWDID
jgi:hypothetical protein